MPGSFVFPFSWSEKLDKALDEAVVVCYNSSVKRYKVNTPVRISANGSFEEAPKYFLYKLAKDEAEEYPNGSGKYKHTFSLVEATKYLEGVMCQTLTFTNTLASETAPGYPVMYGWLENGNARPQIDAMGLRCNSISTPVSSNTYAIPTAKTACTAALASLNAALQTNYTLAQAYTGYLAKTGGVEVASTSDWEAENTVTIVDGILTITYSMNLYVGFGNYEVWHFTVQVKSAQSTYKEKQTRKLTIADVLSRICNLAEPIFSAGTPQNLSRFEIAETDIEELENILSPDFAISQSTLREQLQMVGSIIHAEPRVIDIAPPDAARNDYIYTISFDYYSKQNVSQSPASYLRKKHFFDLSNYVTRIHTNARNIVNTISSANVLTDPGISTFKGLRAEQGNVRISDSNGIVKTLEPIYEIVKVSCGIFYNYETEMQSDSVPLEPVDITAHCYEATEYDSTLSNFALDYPSKAYALRWQRGQKNITGLFFSEPNAVHEALSKYTIVNILSLRSGYSRNAIQNMMNTVGNQLVFQVIYKPVTNTAFIHGKNDYSDEEPYTVAYNQSDALIEQISYGQNIKGAASRMGNPEAEVTAKFSAFSELPKTGNRTEIDGEEYYIASANYEMNPNGIFATFGLSKDFNRISEYIGINSQKRISEISTDQPYDREIVVPSIIILGARPNNYQKKAKVFYGVTEFVYPFSASNRYKITQAIITNESSADVCLPVIASGYGNVAVVTTSLKDNYSAGESETLFDSVDDDKIKGFWQKDTRFGDFFGRCTSINVQFSDYSIPNAKERRHFAFTYPEISAEEITTPRVYLQRQSSGAPLYIAKDSRERLATISFTFEIKTTIPGVTIGSAFASFNSLVYRKTAETDGIRPHLYIVPESGELPYKLDTDIIDYDKTDWDDLGEVGVTSVSTDNVTFSSKTATSNGRGFVVAYPVRRKTITVDDGQQTINEGGEIFFIYNKPVKTGDILLGQQFTLYKE